MRTLLISIAITSFCIQSAPTCAQDSRTQDSRTQDSRTQDSRAQDGQAGAVEGTESDSSSATSGAGTSESASSESGAADPGPLPPDLAPIRDEYVRLMDDMVQARSRVALLGRELFQSRMTVRLQDRTGDDANLEHLVVELDGAPVFRADAEIEAGDEGREVFEGAVAPGPHVIAIEMEEHGRTDSEYRAIRRDSFRFIVVRDRLTEVRITLEDDTDIDRSFPSNGEGHFETKTRVRVAARPLRSGQ